MLYRALLGFLCLFVILACGGAGNSLGIDSDVVIDVEGVNGANASELYLSISPLNGAHNTAEAATSNQAQPWVTRTQNNQFQRFEFQTDDNAVPYQVWVGTTVAFDRECRIVVKIDGVERFNQTGTALAGTPQRVVKITRNDID